MSGERPGIMGSVMVATRQWLARRVLPGLPRQAEDWEQRPYFCWDADLSWRQYHAALHSADDRRRRWALARLLDGGRWTDIWRLVSLEMIAGDLPHLRIRSQAVWARLIEVASSSRLAIAS